MIEVTEVQFTRFNARRPEDSLQGFISFSINQSFRVGNVALHFKNDEYFLVYPNKVLANNTIITVFSPMTDAVAKEIRAQVLPLCGIEV